VLACVAQLFAKEVANVLRDHITVFFQREVASVEQVKLEILQVTLVRMGSLSRKNVIVLAPNDQRRRLMLTQVGLPLWIEAWITAVVQEHRKLDRLIALAIKQRLDMSPCVGLITSTSRTP
jgi:hypothetical protein